MSQPPGGVRAALLHGITRNVVALGVVSFLTDISSELLVYVIPLFLANVLAASPSVIGLIEGVAESASAFLKLASGAISDRFRRRKLLVGTGYATSVAAKALYLLASSWPVVFAARLGDRVGKGIRTAPRDALIANSTPPEARGRAFGLHRALDTFGAVVGVGLAAVVVGALQGDNGLLGEGTFRALVLLALVPGIAALVAIALGVRDVRPASRAAPEPVEASPAPLPVSSRLGLRERLGAFPAPFWLFVGASALFTLGNSSDAFLALRSQALGVAVRDLLLMIIAFNLANAFVAWPVGALSDRVGRRGLIALAWGIYAASYLGFALAGSAAPVAFLWILYGTYYGVNEAVGRALVSDLAMPDLRATAYGILNSVTGLAILPASVVAGVLWDRVGQAAPFWFGAACALAAVALLPLVRPVARERQSAKG